MQASKQASKQASTQASTQASKQARRQHFVCPGGSITSRPWHKSNKTLTARLTGMAMRVAKAWCTLSTDSACLGEVDMSQGR